MLTGSRAKCPDAGWLGAHGLDAAFDVGCEVGQIGLNCRTAATHKLTRGPPLIASKASKRRAFLFGDNTMDLEQFFSRPSGLFSGAFDSRHFNQDLSDEVRDLARLGLKLFPVSLSAKLAGDPNRLIAVATDDVTLLEELSAAAQPLWGYRLALGPSGLCVLILAGTVGRASFTALVPGLDECLTLQERRGDAVYAFFRQPTGMKRIASERKLAPGVSILGEGESCIVPPFGGAGWVDPRAEIETLPYALRELLAVEDPDNFPGLAMSAPKPSPRQVPCRPAARFPQPNRAPRKGHPACNQAPWRSGYRIYRQR